ncbi:MAG: hypothetical protein ACU83V_05420 [Gammaproteobacteria bacterium]
MNTLKIILVFVFLTSTLAAANISVAGVAQSDTDGIINNTVAHLDAASKAIEANELDAAQDHMKAASQSAKNIIGGSLEVKTQRGSRAIANARRQTREGDLTSAAASLKDAQEIFKSLLQVGKSGGRGGLN